MNAQDLKNSILQRAIEGKLVPQRKEEGTAKELLAEIRTEKARLIKEKKIKKSKPLPEITDEEKPFDIPENWEWVRLKNVCLPFRYGTTKKSLKNGKIPVLRMGNIKNGEIDYKNLVYSNDECDIEKYSLDKYDLLFNRTNSREWVGKTAIYRGENPAIFAGYLIQIKPIICDSEYLNYVMNSQLERNYCKRVKSDGINQSNVNAQKIGAFTIPLPPLAEQHRIVAKIEELQPDIDAYDKAQTKLQSIEQSFPDDMKKSLLQYAIEGKLVPQRKEEGTAKDLLAKIRAEKARLVKEKKIKKSKPLPAITDDEKPFDIPDSWEWVRLEEIGTIIGGGTPKTQILEYWDGDIPWLTPADMKFIGKYAMSGNRNISLLGLQKSSARLMPKGTVLFSSRAPIGYIAIAKNKICTNQGFKSVVPFIMHCNEYIYYCLQARIKDIQLRASGTTFKEISGSEFGKTMIPLPPLAEQHRIVAKLEELLPLCQQLVSQS